jgi:hypothetical protein
MTPSQPPVVGVTFEAPAQKARRATVAFRFILAIPHLLWTIILGLVATIVVIVGWFGALFTGRMPEGIGDFLARIVQYTTRVNGYMYLLTDTYPPFSLDATNYPITTVFPARGKLNRAAVLFRLILAIPAGIVTTVVSSGLQLVLLVVWLITLVSGRLPRSAFEAEAAALRYQTRFYAWAMMLTSEYPSGLFGEPALPAPTSDIPPPPPAAGAIPPPPPAPGAAAYAPEAPRITSLVLSKPGRRLLVTFIVLGVVINVGQIVVAIVAAATTSESLRDLDDAYDEVIEESADYGRTLQTCAISGDGEQCVATANGEFSDEVRDFAADLEEIDFPEGTLDEAEDLRDDALAVADVLSRMASSTSDVNAYEALVTEFQTVTTRLDEHYLDLRDAIRFGG